MTAVIQFDGVSKQYHLGVSRTSLLTSVSTTAKQLFSRHQQTVSQQPLFWALHDVSFTLTAGDCLGLVGENGAGKSTLLKLLASITRPTLGQIRIRGRISALIELGSGFHPDLTGRENVYLNGTILGLSRREISHRFEEMVAFSELERFIDTPVKRYSSGMVVRLGFAVASCIEPDILLIDEVLAVGDAAFQQKCMQRIRALLNRGTTIIFVSHNLYMVQAICPQSLYMKQGEIKERGKTSAVIDVYERDLHEGRAAQFARLQTIATAGIGLVEISRVELLRDNGATTSEFYGDQPLEIRIHYHCYQSPGLSHAVVRIIRADGITCCMMRTKLDGAELMLHEGAGAFSVCLETLQLTGGTYYIDARLTNDIDSVVLASGWSAWFYVSGWSLSHEEESGIFEPRRRWQPDALALPPLGAVMGVANLPDGRSSPPLYNSCNGNQLSGNQLSTQGGHDD